jgi:hypothetical protein
VGEASTEIRKGGLAHLVERNAGSVEARGSNPLISTTIKTMIEFFKKLLGIEPPELPPWHPRKWEDLTDEDKYRYWKATQSFPEPDIIPPVFDAAGKQIQGERSRI